MDTRTRAPKDRRPTSEIEQELLALRRQRQQISARTRVLGDILYNRRRFIGLPPEERKSRREIMGY